MTRATIPFLLAALLFLAAPPAAQAQPTITSDDLLGLIGSFQLVEFDSSSTSIAVDVGSAGTNQTWDFRSLTFEPALFGISYLDPADTPFAEEFAGANLAQEFAIEEQVDFEFYNYYNVTSSSFATLGQGTRITAPFDTAIVNYQDDDIAPLPITFGTSWTSASADTTGQFPAFAIITTDTTENVVDAWGTVRLPVGDFEVLRLRSDTKESQQTVVAGQVLSSTTTSRISYAWINADAFLVAEVESQDGETDPNFTTATSFLRVTSSGATANEPGSGLPGSELRLAPYPNPARFGSTVSYRIPRGEHVELAVYDVLGQRVRTLVDASRLPGEHTVRWNGDDARGNRVAAGVYLIRLDAGDASTTRKITILR